jgi:hypothetical protein
MTADKALDEPLIRRIFARAIDRLDTQPMAQRTNALRIELDSEMAIEIHNADSLAARDLAWIAIDAVEATGWAKVGYRRHARHGARQDRQPYLDINWTDEAEDFIRAKLHRPRKVASYGSRWRSLVAESRSPLSPTALARIQSSPIEVPGRAIEDVLARLMSIRGLVNEPLLLREVSSRTFWGLSKLLDGRGEVIAAVVGADECPFPEQPIVLNIHLPCAPSAFLFIENHVAFERLKRKPHLGDIALIYCAGFRAASLRLRSRNGCSVYYTRDSRPDAMMPFENGLFSDSPVPTFFWGDLDYAGMAILASLRSAFPTATAWQIGYAPMVERLRERDGHSPLESGKERQRPVEWTGCPYADSVLIPALKTSGQFVDQE